ncbi:MAG: phage/plasmid primase, P4 family [Armatimonadota bacterium]|nr:phage/plasmid primase, P4 family [Armatimonadota bacterium]
MSATAERFKLLDAGYRGHLVPIRPGTKAPAAKNWLDVAFPDATILQWAGPIGLRGAEFPGVDIDSKGDPERARGVLRVVLRELGRAPVRSSADPGSLLAVYRSESPLPRVSVVWGDGQVELLGRGRQYLVHGAHPSGALYGWLRTPLWEVHADSLPVVTLGSVERAFRAIQEAYGGELHVASGPGDVEVGPQELAAPDPGEALRVIARMPNTDAFLSEALPPCGHPRDYWVAMGHAIKGALGDAGEDAFVEWTSRYADGPVDLDDARVVYRGLRPRAYGWPLLRRVRDELLDRVDAADEFDGEPLPLVARAGEPQVGVWGREAVGVEMSDEGVARRLCAALAGRLMYVHGRWYVWNQTRWVDGHEGLAELVVRDLLLGVVQHIHSEAGRAYWPAQAYASAVRRSQALLSRGRLQAVMAHLSPMLSVPRTELDADPWLLGTPGGPVDLRTGELVPPSPSQRITRSTRVVPAATCDQGTAPRWLAFLDACTGGDRELQSWLQRWCGYNATAWVHEKTVVFVWGEPPDTGKSTFLRAVASAMGDYSATDTVALVLGGVSGDRRQQGLARLAGVRMFYTTEPGEGSVWDDQTLKAVTGGDRVSGRFLYGEPFEFDPQFKVTVAGNVLPEFRAGDPALLRRVVVVPFPYQVPKDQQDPWLARALDDEAPGILRWVVDGAIAWARGGLGAARAVSDATTNYHTDEGNVLGEWLHEMCEVGGPEWTSSVELYGSWRAWCTARALRPTSYQSFTRALRRIPALTYARRAHQRGYTGVRLRDPFQVGGTT